MVNVQCSVTTRRDDIDEGQGATIKIHSHWNRPDFVVLEIDNQRFVVVAKELITAIDNATRTAKY